MVNFSFRVACLLIIGAVPVPLQENVVEAQTTSACFDIRLDRLEQAAVTGLPQLLVRDPAHLREIQGFDADLCSRISGDQATASMRGVARAAIGSWIAYRAACDGTVAQQSLESLPTRPLLAVSRFCSDISSSPENEQRRTAITALMTLDADLFCLGVESFDLPGANWFPFRGQLGEFPSVERLRVVGDSLCAGLRSGEISQQAARIRMVDEVLRMQERLPGEAVQVGTTAVGRSLKWVGTLFVAFLGVVATLLGIIKGLKELNRRD